MSSDYFRKQAATCLHLSRQCFDLNVAEKLRLMAAGFMAKADEIEERNFLPVRIAEVQRRGS